MSITEIYVNPVQARAIYDKAATEEVRIHILSTALLEAVESMRNENLYHAVCELVLVCSDKNERPPFDTWLEFARRGSAAKERHESYCSQNEMGGILDRYFSRKVSQDEH